MTTTEVLRQFINDRKKANPRLSLRSIASKMGISSGRLSELLNGKRRLTEYHIDKFCLALKLTPQNVASLRQAYHHEHSQDANTTKTNYGTLLSEEQIEKLSDWKPYAIMSFLQTTTYASMIKKHPLPEQQISWLAKRMELSVVDLSTVIRILNETNLIQWEEDHWVPTYSKASTGYDIPNKVIQEAHAQDLALARSKLNSVDVLRRDFSSMTIAINPKDITKAKKLIRAFRREFANALEKGQKKDVYQISIQFFPLIESAGE